VTALLLALALQGAPDRAGLEFFEQRIRPVLAERCYRCHSARAEKLKGGLRLDTREGLLRGGNSERPAVVPGDPDKSLLLLALRHADEDLKMPPKEKLPDREIADFATWVRRGAPYPETAPPKSASAPEIPWSFQPLADVSPPDVKDPGWVRTPIDRFILAGLEKAGLAPAPPADRRTLIRRAAFDLVGLPPAPEEVEAFAGDDSPGAFAALVDRLLASPHYGERWGRHWLDVARYADSNGLDENAAFAHAWRYRDYVVRAFNGDKPYDRFVLEQLAGDLEEPAADPATRHERLTATGFLSLGPKVLAEPDERKLEMDIIDEQIDTVGRAFLGLTLGCARCHDHKFDPITTADYYGLAGIFKSTRTMSSLKRIARWHEHTLASPPEMKVKEAHEKLVAARKQTVHAFVERANQQLLLEGKLAALPEKPEALYPPETRRELEALRRDLKRAEESAPAYPQAMGVTDGAVTDVAVHRRGDPHRLGPVVPRRFPAALAGGAAPPGAENSGRLALARWIASPDHPLTARVMVNRIWRWHFGRGLVGTPDNFGALGEPPTHRELLDWLASRFVRDGWSVKRMHRLILMSATYQMSSRPDDGALQRDPDNRLWSRFRLRRLDAESLRDAMLDVSGLLDRTLGGTLFHHPNYELVFNHTSRDKTTYDSFRRSLYLPVIRNHVYDMFELFDFPNPNTMEGHRAETTVASQSLFLMNAPLVLRAADALAAGLLRAEGGSDADRIRRLYGRVYGRLPREGELGRAAEFLGRYAEAQPSVPPDAARRLAWQALCQAALVSNEFLHVR
jgi:hypothetical protein